MKAENARKGGMWGGVAKAFVTRDEFNRHFLRLIRNRARGLRVLRQQAMPLSPRPWNMFMWVVKFGYKLTDIEGALLLWWTRDLMLLSPPGSPRRARIAGFGREMIATLVHRHTCGPRTLEQTMALCELQGDLTTAHAVVQELQRQAASPRTGSEASPTIGLISDDGGGESQTAAVSAELSPAQLTWLLRVARRAVQDDDAAEMVASVASEIAARGIACRSLRDALLAVAPRLDLDTHPAAPLVQAAMEDLLRQRTKSQHGACSSSVWSQWADEHDEAYHNPTSQHTALNRNGLLRLDEIPDEWTVEHPFPMLRSQLPNRLVAELTAAAVAGDPAKVATSIHGAVELMTRRWTQQLDRISDVTQREKVDDDDNAARAMGRAGGGDDANRSRRDASAQDLSAQLSWTQWKVLGERMVTDLDGFWMSLAVPGGPLVSPETARRSTPRQHGWLAENAEATAQHRLLRTTAPIKPVSVTPELYHYLVVSLVSRQIGLALQLLQQMVRAGIAPLDLTIAVVVAHLVRSGDDGRLATPLAQQFLDRHDARIAADRALEPYEHPAAELAYWQYDYVGYMAHTNRLSEQRFYVLVGRFAGLLPLHELVWRCRGPNTSHGIPVVGTSGPDEDAVEAAPAAVTGSLMAPPSVAATAGDGDRRLRETWLRLTSLVPAHCFAVRDLLARLEGPADVDRGVQYVMQHAPQLDVAIIAQTIPLFKDYVPSRPLFYTVADLSRWLEEQRRGGGGADDKGEASGGGLSKRDIVLLDASFLESSPPDFYNQLGGATVVLPFMTLAAIARAVTDPPPGDVDCLKVHAEARSEALHRLTVLCQLVRHDRVLLLHFTECLVARRFLGASQPKNGGAAAVANGSSGNRTSESQRISLDNEWLVAVATLMRAAVVHMQQQGSGRSVPAAGRDEKMMGAAAARIWVASEDPALLADLQRRTVETGLRGVFPLRSGTDDAPKDDTMVPLANEGSDNAGSNADVLGILHGASSAREPLMPTVERTFVSRDDDGTARSPKVGATAVERSEEPGGGEADVAPQTAPPLRSPWLQSILDADDASARIDQNAGGTSPRVDGATDRVPHLSVDVTDPAALAEWLSGSVVEEVVVVAAEQQQEPSQPRHSATRSTTAEDGRVIFSPYSAVSAREVMNRALDRPSFPTLATRTARRDDDNGEGPSREMVQRPLPQTFGEEFAEVKQASLLDPTRASLFLASMATGATTQLDRDAVVDRSGDASLPYETPRASATSGSADGFAGDPYGAETEEETALRIGLHHSQSTFRDLCEMRSIRQDHDWHEPLSANEISSRRRQLSRLSGMSIPADFKYRRFEVNAADPRSKGLIEALKHGTEVKRDIVEGVPSVFNPELDSQELRGRKRKLA